MKEAAACLLLPFRHERASPSEPALFFFIDEESCQSLFVLPSRRVLRRERGCACAHEESVPSVRRSPSSGKSSQVSF